MTAKKPVAKAEKAGKTNKTEKSLVKVVVLEDMGKWLRPDKASSHFIDEDANMPDVTFEIETNAAEPYTWSWKIVWEAKVSGIRESEKRGKLLKKFEESGSFTNGSKSWKVDFAGKILGGLLTVEVNAGEESFKRSIYIKGKNPSKDKIKEYSDSLDGTKGFDKILMHEALGKNFINADGAPVVSFDKGYGITQMTNPAPNYQQCWSWKENIKGGSSIYREKRSNAKKHLDHHGNYSEEQLQMETWSRYNGGAYHEWDSKSKAWKTNDYICDTEVANVGWNKDIALNKDGTAAELRERDKEQFKLGKDGQTKEHPWTYTGVCYANYVKNK